MLQSFQKQIYKKQDKASIGNYNNIHVLHLNKDQAPRHAATYVG